MRKEIDHSVLEGDNIVTVKNEYVELGINLALGGAVTYFAEHGRPNLINSADWGRQVQMSFYSGPVPFEPDGHEVSQSWKSLGWNPIQCGDCYGNRSEILLCERENGKIHVKCRPMHWPLDNFPGECTFEEWFELDGKSVKVHARLNNDRPDKTLYSARSQELPAVYTNGVWYKLVSYVGTKPFTGDDVTVLVDKDDGKGWPWIDYRPTESWAALLDDDNYGLGVCNPYTNHFIGGFAGLPKGKGGPKDGPTGYISPLLTEILDPDIVYDYYYTLTAGTLEEIRAYALTQVKPQTREFSFSENRSHWHYGKINDMGWKHGSLEFDFSSGDTLRSPEYFYDKIQTLSFVGDIISDGDVNCVLHARIYEPISGGTTNTVEATRNFVLHPNDTDDGMSYETMVVFGEPLVNVMGFSIEFSGAGHARLSGISIGSENPDENE